MAFLLNIDAATEAASVCISLNGKDVAIRENNSQKEHASFIHKAIEEVLKESGVTLADTDAISVTSGPGSYTGLRVGMAAAKGFCFALQKPLITINTLEVMTKAALDSVSGIEANVLFAPMIDARRMEVFTALYSADLTNILLPAPVLLGQNIFNKYITNNKIVFFGSGSTKFKEVAKARNFIFADVKHTASHLGILADKAFKQKKFANLSYSQPEYFKEFHFIKKSLQE